MEEKLIEAVRAHSCLYDKSSHLFRNKLLKEKAWDAVACAVGVPVTNCQTRWKSLRDRFVRKTGLQKKKSGSGAEDGATWQYLEAMDFMRGFVAPRKTFSNLDFTSQEEEINGISQCNVTETSYYEEYEVRSPLPSVAANDTEQSNSAKKIKTASCRRRGEREVRITMRGGQ
ncbi:uncharacterized protein LOC118736112 [Rhagoletis pomonella]|uniref:uncharacterized protein LOC118736112 n=1 Tax=Rhagoletis pomonella TaxID=28610 RepID=UPI001783CC7E|nr:uncharacterized protein LOC118736112 [Rhagoletis pomonella]